MAIEKPVIKSEDNAEQQTVTGWVCKTCRRFWGDDERMARYCCSTDFPCACGNRHGKGWTCCKACREKHEDEKWAKRERRPWDGTGMLYSDTMDRWFSSVEDLEGHVLDITDDGGKDDSLQGLHERFRIIICEENKPRTFEMEDYLCDELHEGSDIHARDINKIVNDWIQAQRPLSWTPGRYAWNGEVVAAASPQPKE